MSTKTVHRRQSMINIIQAKLSREGLSDDDMDFVFQYLAAGSDRDKVAVLADELVRLHGLDWDDRSRDVGFIDNGDVE
jgi:hypothetical protein